MRLVFIPGRLWLTAGLLFLCVPIAALETWIASRAPWWSVSLRSVGTWAAIAFVVTLPLCYWTLRGKLWVRPLATAIALCWSVSSASMALRMGNSALAFFTVFLLAYWTVVLFVQRTELGRSYIDPRTHWYQALPLPIPVLSCKLKLDLEHSVRVSRMDRDGASLISPQAALPCPAGLFDLWFSYGEREAHCRGRVIRCLSGNRGLGVQFVGMTPDARKQLGDFVERLQGEGHGD